MRQLLSNLPSTIPDHPQITPVTMQVQNYNFHLPLNSAAHIAQRDQNPEARKFAEAVVGTIAQNLGSMRIGTLYDIGELHGFPEAQKHKGREVNHEKEPCPFFSTIDFKNAVESEIRTELQRLNTSVTFHGTVQAELLQIFVKFFDDGRTMVIQAKKLRGEGRMENSRIGGMVSALNKRMEQSIPGW